jgi:hypothetical protein
MGNSIATPVAHTVNTFVIMVWFSILGHSTGWRMKWPSIWCSIKYSAIQWTMFCNMVTLT